MAKYKVGDKVRILDVDAILFGRAFWRDGDITEVIDVDEDTVSLYGNDGIGDEVLRITPSEMHAIEKVQTKEEAGHSALLSRILALELRVAKLEGEGTAKSPEEISNPFPWLDGKVEYESAKTPNERRKEAIAKAKKFVDSVVARGSDGDTFSDDTGGNDIYQNHYYVVDFVVNEEKRTVVAIVHLAYRFEKVTNRPDHKGIAKCNPDDVFNADIGKAVALGRAFGLDVSEFEMAPQPSEVVAGMVVKASEHSLYVTEPFLVKFDRDDNAHEEERGWIPTEIAEIVSDTEAKY